MVDRQFTSVDEYIGSFPADVQAILEAVRRTIRKVVPTAGETISYQMPTITLDGTALLYFAGWKHHISRYPAPTGDEVFAQDLAPYTSAKSNGEVPALQANPVRPHRTSGGTPRRTAAGRRWLRLRSTVQTGT